ncbi:uncharacterized protein LOC144145793 isoform X1 [Haemaphysalis longicornis]
MAEKVTSDIDDEYLFSRDRAVFSPELLDDVLSNLAKRNDEAVRNPEEYLDYLSPSTTVELVFQTCARLKLPISVQLTAVEFLDRFLVQHVRDLRQQLGHPSGPAAAASNVSWDDVVTRLRGQVTLRLLSCIQLASKMSSTVRPSRDPARPEATGYSFLPIFAMGRPHKGSSGGTKPRGQHDELRSGTALPKLPKRCSRRWSKVYLVPYVPSLSPIFEEERQDRESHLHDTPSHRPLLLTAQRLSSYGVVTPRLRKVVITIDEDESGSFDGDRVSSWAARARKAFTLSWLFLSVSSIAVMGGVLMIWMAMVDLLQGESKHRNAATAFVGFTIVGLAALVVVLKAVKGATCQ